MNLMMSYIDYNMATLEEREVFSCSKTAVENIYDYLKNVSGVSGSVIIATCNRTEIYLSLEEGERINPFELLCDALNLDYRRYEHINRTLGGEDVLFHLSRVAAGAESQIWGDYQIISQVGEAYRSALKLKSTDSILNVAFRLGITAGKKIKTRVDFNVNDNSTASRAVNIILKNGGITSALVIGNGMIGRLVAGELAHAGIRTTMTLRQYRHGEIKVPKGVDTVNYNDRNEVIEISDAVVSATLSPHFTVHYDDMVVLKKLPKLFIDLAVPRDIDPKLKDISGVKCYNVDEISQDVRSEKQREQLKVIDGIIEKYIFEFNRWYDYREKLRSSSGGEYA